MRFVPKATQRSENEEREEQSERKEGLGEKESLPLANLGWEPAEAARNGHTALYKNAVTM